MPNGVSVAHVGVEFGSDSPWLAQRCCSAAVFPRRLREPGKSPGETRRVFRETGKGFQVEREVAPSGAGESRR